MGVLKKYVHNHAQPEGSITKGYGTKAVIEFCVDFIPDLNPIGVPESRHEVRLSGKGTLGKKAYIGRDADYFWKSTLHGSVKLLLGGSVYRGTQGHYTVQILRED